MNPRNSRVARRLLAAGLALTLVAAVPGCLVSGSRHVKTKGRYVGAQSLSMIEPGVTDAAWVRAVLGEPTDIRTLPGDGREVWIWEFTKTRRAKTEVLVVFDGSKSTVMQQRVFVEFADGVVTRTWREAQP